MEPLRLADHLVSSVGEHPQGRKFDFAGQNVQTLPADRGYCPLFPGTCRCPRADPGERRGASAAVVIEGVNDYGGISAVVASAYPARACRGGSFRRAVRVAGTRSDGTRAGLGDWLGQRYCFARWVAQG